MERVDYETLKQWFFEDAYIGCQRKFKGGKIYKWVGDKTEWRGALYSFENTFDTPIENLMLYTIAVITDAGRNKVYHANLMNKIDDILKHNEIKNLVGCLEEEERQAFLYDLNLVLNNREIEE